MKYGYARVSTVGQNLSTQLEALAEEGCTKVYKDYYTGTKADRPDFKKVLDILKEGDTLVVTKLDRFARSTVDALQITEMLFKRGVKVHILNMGLIEDNSMGRLILTMISGFAQFERDMIIERTQEGKAIAKQRDDFREGRPRKHSKKQVEHALKLLETHSYKEVENMTGINKRTLMRRKNEQKEKEVNEG